MRVLVVACIAMALLAGAVSRQGAVPAAAAPSSTTEVSREQAGFIDPDLLWCILYCIECEIAQQVGQPAEHACAQCEACRSD